MMVSKRRADRRPHEQVAESLRQRIRLGQWRSGQHVPGRAALAREHGVALGTVERAVATLISEGMLRADDRRGTFVTGSESDAETRSLSPILGPSDNAALVATVGIVAPIVPYSSVDTYEGQWPVQILHACEHRLAAEPGLTMHFLNLVNTGQPDLPIEAAVRQLVDDRVGVGILLLATPSPTALSCLRQARVPVVIGNLDRFDSPVPQVYIDSVPGAQMAACHLLERGYRKLLYFQPFHCDWSEERLAGVRAGIASLGLPPQTLTVLPPNPDALVGLDNVQRQMALAAARDVLATGFAAGTGVVAPNDTAAEAFIEVAAERKLAAGRDYGIVGFDDRARDCGLTSLRPPLATLGDEAARLAIRLLRSEDAPNRVVLEHRLIARTSSLPRMKGEG